MCRMGDKSRSGHSHQIQMPDTLSAFMSSEISSMDKLSFNLIDVRTSDIGVNPLSLPLVFS